MFKTLAGKVLIPVGMAVTGFVVVCCLILYSVIRDDVNRDTISNATSLADTILKSTRYAMLKSDRETLGTIIRNVGEQTGVEHVRIFNDRGVVNISSKASEINHQLDKKAEGCIACHQGPVPTTTLGTMQQARKYINNKGKEVMAITAPIYNEPECSNASCHVHSPSQKVLGTLDIGLSHESFVKSLANIRTQMIVFTIMTLMLTVGGVTALLRRSVFLPLQRLGTFMEHVDKDGCQNSPPPHLPHELDSIAKSYCDLSLKLRSSEQELDNLKKSMPQK